MNPLLRRKELSQSDEVEARAARFTNQTRIRQSHFSLPKNEITMTDLCLVNK